MKNNIITSNGTEIQLVRYFSLQGKKYLIFIDNQQLDPEGHMTINISEVDEVQGLNANAVLGDSYETVKGFIKDVIKANKNNTPLAINDLNYAEINGINIIGSAKLKLMENFVNILMQNQPQFETPIVQENTVNEVPANWENPVPEQNVVPSTIEMSPSIAPEPFQTFEQPIIPTPIEPTTPSVDYQMNPVVEQPTFVQPEPAQEMNYQQMYMEQVELVNKLQTENEMYKNKLETLKNIINN